MVLLLNLMSLFILILFSVDMIRLFVLRRKFASEMFFYNKKIYTNNFILSWMALMYVAFCAMLLIMSGVGANHFIEKVWLGYASPLLIICALSTGIFISKNGVIVDSKLIKLDINSQYEISVNDSFSICNFVLRSNKSNDQIAGIKLVNSKEEYVTVKRNVMELLDGIEV